MLNKKKLIIKLLGLLTSAFITYVGAPALVGLLWGVGLGLEGEKFWRLLVLVIALRITFEWVKRVVVDVFVGYRGR